MTTIDHGDDESTASQDVGANAELDGLSIFDRESIGKEFKEGNFRVKGRSRTTEQRRDALTRDRWHEATSAGKAKSASQQVGTASSRFARVRKFEEDTVHLQAKVFWSVFVIIVVVSVIVYGFILKTWSLQF
jgi:hypothetical protein